MLPEPTEPATPADLTAEITTLRRELEDAKADLARWRSVAIDRWEHVATNFTGNASEIEAMRNSVSWRVTRPLRAVRSRMARSR